MNRRSAASSRSGHRRWCVATFARSWCAAAVWFLMIASQERPAATLAAEPAPMPPAPREDPFRFAPQIRDPLAPPPPSDGRNGNAETLLDDRVIRGLDASGSEVAGAMAEAPSSAASPRLFRRREERYVGPGQPLIQESWSFRPFSIGGVFGLIQGGTLIDDWVRDNQGVVGGVQLGWDCENYWGFETRFAWAEAEVVDSDRAIAAQHAKDDAAGLKPEDRARHRFDSRRNNHLFFWDAHVLYYPWGDAAWRPYVMIGFGATAVDFIDRTDVTYTDTLFTLPLGLGVKYRVNDFFAVRMEAADYMAFGGGHSLEFNHNVTVLGGVEVRFGGSRRAYWPWNPGRHYW